MSDDRYRVPFRQNDPTLIMSIEAPKLMGTIVLWVGPAVFGLGLVGMILGLSYWIFYNRMRGNGTLKGAVLHGLWRMGLWVDGNKYKYDPNNPDLHG